MNFISKLLGFKITKRLASKYIIIIASALTVFALSFASIYFVFGSSKTPEYHPDNSLLDQDNLGDSSGDSTKKPDSDDDDLSVNDPNDANLIDELFSTPRKTNILVMGLDQGGHLSDINIAICFDSYTGAVDFISVPRDTYVKIDSDDLEALRASGSYVPADGTVKLTELHSYGGSEGHAYSKKYIGRMLGVSFNYYAEINIKAFRYIVDQVGPIEMEIPSPGLYWNDPIQNLHIAIPPGMQQLYGKDAEGVMRYRSYSNADIGRISVQHKFMTAFFTQVLAKETIMNNLQTFAVSFMEYVKTDFPISDLTKYLKPIMNLSAESFSFYTAPGDADNSKYYNLHDEEVKELVNSTFLNYDLGLDNFYRNLKIQVLNGSATQDAVDTTVKKLRALGFANAVAGEDYSGAKENRTRIITVDKSYTDIIKYLFNKPLIDTSSDLSTGFDIVIVLGANDK